LFNTSVEDFSNEAHRLDGRSRNFSFGGGAV
jgi:hypothetical protein